MLAEKQTSFQEQFLYEDLAKAPAYLLEQTEIYKSTGEMTEKHILVHGSRKGNKAYALQRKNYFIELQKEVNKRARIKQNDDKLKSSNIAFITLTLKQDNISELESWELIKSEVPKFIRTLKSKLDISSYIKVLEAHASGYAHSHIVLVLDDEMKVHFKDRKGKNRNTNLLDVVNASWGYGKVDVQLSDANISKYIVKEIGKFGEVETSLKKYAKGKHDSNDIKKIQSMYFSKSLGYRSISLSRDLSSVINESLFYDDDNVANIEILVHGAEGLVYTTNNTTDIITITRIIPINKARLKVNLARSYLEGKYLFTGELKEGILLSAIKETIGMC